MTEAFECNIIEAGSPAGRGVNIAAVCMKIQYDKHTNLSKYSHFIKTAAEKGVHLIVFPEQTVMGYLWEPMPSWTLQPEVFQHHYLNAETVPGPATNLFSEYARRYNMHIIIGMTERNPHYGGGTAGLFNSAVLIGPDGVIGIHRKVHLPGGEKHIYRPGNSFCQYQTPLAKIGMIICYDIFFPESCRVHAIGGADMIAFPTAWPSKLRLKVEHKPTAEATDSTYNAMLTTRALENQVWLIAGASTGVDEKQDWEYWGHAKIIDPCGETIVETGVEEGMAIAYGLDIPGKILEARTTRFLGNNLLADRYPWLYGPITQTDIAYPSYAPKEPRLVVEEEVQQASDVDQSC